MGRGVTAGVYIYTLQTEDARFSRKMLLLDGNQASASSAAAAVEPPVSAAAPVMHKTSSNNFTITVEGVDIEGYEEDIEITGNMTLPITVNRTMTGNDGIVYRTVKIGDQWWMAENLAETHFRNGDIILGGYIEDTEWRHRAQESVWCVFKNNPENEDIYGLLYSWFTVVDDRNLASPGWRVPTDDDWKLLELSLGMDQEHVDTKGMRGTNEGSMLAGAELWHSGMLSENPSFGKSGFNAVPAGYRDSHFGYFLSLGETACWLSSTEDTDDPDSALRAAWVRGVYYDDLWIVRTSYFATGGRAVRLIKE